MARLLMLAIVVLLAACGGDDDAGGGSVTTAAATVTTVAITTTTAPPKALDSATAVADALSAAGLGCSDRTTPAPTQAPGYPEATEVVRCTIDGSTGAITFYANDGDGERAALAYEKQLCDLDRAQARARAIVHGNRFALAPDVSTPKVAAALGATRRPFTCA